MVQKLCYASKSVTEGRTGGRTDGRTHARTNVPEAICPSNFFEVGGIINCLLQFHSCFTFEFSHSSVMVFSLARRGSIIRFHLLWHTVELAMSTRLCLLL